MKTATYSNETKTIIQLFERLSSPRRKRFLERIQDLLLEQESDAKWDDLLESSPEPMIRMAKIALREHKQGRSKSFRL